MAIIPLTKCLRFMERDLRPANASFDELDRPGMRLWVNETQVILMRKELRLVAVGGRLKNLVSHPSHTKKH
jgi:hypothetical protein